MGSIDRNTIIGILLIFLLFYLWAKMNAPTEAELAEMEHRRDSISAIQVQPLESETGEALDSTRLAPKESEEVADSAVTDATLVSRYGLFANSATGSEQDYVIENNHMKITLTNKGGRIKEVLLKDYLKLEEDENRKDRTTPLLLMEDEKNKFEYLLPVRDASSRFISTADLFFDVREEPGIITFRARISDGQFFEQKYELNEDSYHLDYSIRCEGLEDILREDEQTIQLNWVNYLDKIEKNTHACILLSTTNR
jgi:YidC/Oxa1 family membrane protein insertase